MKTYFMAWETDNKRGHVIWEFEPSGDKGNEISPREALRTMLEAVKNDFSGDLRGVISASQFNQVT